MGIILASGLRAFMVYLLILILTRIIGRKQISMMTFFNFVVGITLGSVAAIITVGPRGTPLSITTILIVFTGLTMTTDFLSIKSRRFQKEAESEPVVMIANGAIIEDNMRKIRLNINDLLRELRKKNVFDIGDVEFALMEIDGELSVLKRSQKELLTPSDIHMPTIYHGLTKDLIMDGEVLEENLYGINLDKDWLQKNIVGRGFQSPKEIFYAGLDTQGNLYISPKNTGEKETHGKYGIE